MWHQTAWTNKSLPSSNVSRGDNGFARTTEYASQVEALIAASLHVIGELHNHNVCHGVTVLYVGVCVNKATVNKWMWTKEKEEERLAHSHSHSHTRIYARAEHSSIQTSFESEHYRRPCCALYTWVKRASECRFWNILTRCVPHSG